MAIFGGSSYVVVSGTLTFVVGLVLEEEGVVTEVLLSWIANSRCNA